jgi:hypothetical protein
MRTFAQNEFETPFFVISKTWRIVRFLCPVSRIVPISQRFEEGPLFPRRARILVIKGSSGLMKFCLSHLLYLAYLIVHRWSVETINGAAGRRVSKWKTPPALETGWPRPFSGFLV